MYVNDKVMASTEREIVDATRGYLLTPFERYGQNDLRVGGSA